MTVRAPGVTGADPWLAVHRRSPTPSPLLPKFPSTRVQLADVVADCEDWWLAKRAVRR